MKSSVIAAISAFAASTLAQGSVSDLPSCGQTCINNMLAQSVALGCPYVNGLPDATCLCSNANFGYGIRDCSVAACGGAESAAPV